MAASVFLDHAAGSPLRREVADAMASALLGLPPNPSGAHHLARATRVVLEDARDRVAAAMAVEPRSVVFTGGGTESCNLALRAAPEAVQVAVSAVEHAAVRAAAGARTEVPTILRVDTTGRLDLDAAIEALIPGALVSVMSANNETGVIQPVPELLEALGDRRESMCVHVDAIAAAPCGQLVGLAAGVDLLSLAAHKLGGPAGTGALVVREGVVIEPLLGGGGQERALRPGTQDVAGAVGLATALELVEAERASGAVAAMGARRAQLEAALSALPGVRITSPHADRLESHLHLTIEGVRSEELLLLLDQEGVCAAAGAACASGAPQASHVLLAMGMTTERARGALRLSLATSTTDAEVDAAVVAVAGALARLVG